MSFFFLFSPPLFLCLHLLVSLCLHLVVSLISFLLLCSHTHTHTHTHTTHLHPCFLLCLLIRSLDVLNLIAKVLSFSDDQLETVGLRVPSKNIFSTIISSFTPVEAVPSTGVEVRTPYNCVVSHTILSYLILSYSIPYHTIPYNNIPYHTIPYNTITYHTIPYHTILSCSILSYSIVLYPIIFCSILSYYI